MSSMRNAVQRRNHKERRQPLEREKWGVLEKHKDYSLRAKDYNEKKARLKILRQKAAERNPDEFHYGMLSSKSKKGRKLADRGNSSLSQDAVKLLKTQDMGYLQIMIQKTRRSIHKLEQVFLLENREGIGMLGEMELAGKGQHLVFINDGEEQRYDNSKSVIEDDLGQQKISKPEDDDQDNTMESDGRFKKQMSRQRADEEAFVAAEKRALNQKRKKEQAVRKTKLATLKAQEKDLRDAENELEIQRAKMSNCTGGVTKAGVKWKVRERKA